LEIKIGANLDKTVSMTFSSAPKATRNNKGNSLMTAVSTFVSIDIETTGLSPQYDSIIEVGASKYENGVLVDSFSSLVNPGFPIDEFITKMTGITNEMLENAPELASILPKYLDFLGNDILVGHNINFDINFIYDACESLELRPFDNDFIDTMRIARRMYPELPNHKLDTLIDFFGFTPRQLHRGLYDCELTAECYLKMVADRSSFDTAIAARSRHAQSLSNIVAIEGNENPDSPLFGKVCVFTGALESFTRKEAAQLVVNIGGICADNITKKTNFLILGNNDYCKAIKDGKSAKQKKAEKLISEGADLLIIPEAVFLDILQMERADAPQICDSQTEEISLELGSAVRNTDEMEKLAFSVMETPLKKYLVENNLSPDYLFYRKNKASNAQHSSVYLISEKNPFCRISFKGTPGYFSVPAKYEKLIPDGVDFRKQRNDSQYLQIDIENPEDIANYIEFLQALLETTIDAFPAEFGCCHRFEECSDIKQCIHPDSDRAIRCWYRKNLKSGKIFYGKNRNV